MFATKTDEQRVLHNVYYIMALRNSIISLKKLDNGGSRVEIDREIL